MLFWPPPLRFCFSDGCLSLPERIMIEVQGMWRLYRIQLTTHSLVGLRAPSSRTSALSVALFQQAPWAKGWRQGALLASEHGWLCFASLTTQRCTLYRNTSSFSSSVDAIIMKLYANKTSVSVNSVLCCAESCCLRISTLTLVHQQLLQVQVPQRRKNTTLNDIQLSLTRLVHRVGRRLSFQTKS